MNFSKIAKLSVIFSMIPVIFNAFFPGKIVIITIISTFPLTYILLSYLRQYKIDIDGRDWLKAFMLYGIVMLVRGIIDLKSYTDFTILLSMGIPMLLFLHYSVYLSVLNSSLYSLMRTFVWYVIPLSFILVTKNNLGFMNFGHTISPIYLFIILMPLLPIRIVILISIISIYSFYSDIEDRSNLINIIIAGLIAASYFFKLFPWGLLVMKIFRIVLFVTPIVLLILGIFGTFNIFRDGEELFGGSDYTISDNSGKKNENLLVDSRTPIYQDVFTELDKRNSLFWGLGISGKTNTSLTDFDGYDKVYAEGRPSTESGILNYFQYGGIIGAFLYFMLFFRASYYGIYKSNNWICKMLGVWLAYKFLYSFVEDTLFVSPYSIFILAPIGMCFNKELRRMNDEECKIFFRSMFRKGVTDWEMIKS